MQDMSGSTAENTADWYPGATGDISSAMNDIAQSVAGLLPQTTVENNSAAPIQQ